MSNIDDKLKELWVQIHFKENSVPSIHAGQMTDEAIAAIKQVFAEESSFDKHLRSLIPHDGKWRYVSFNIKIAPDQKIDWVNKAAKKVSGIDE